MWRLVYWQRGQPKPTTVRVYRKRLKCAVGPENRKAIWKRWRKAQRAFFKHRREQLAERRELLRLKPFVGGGKRWPIPYSIVACESGGNYRARNAVSTAGGAFQIIDSTWYAYGGARYADSHPAAVAPPAEQDRVAAAIWADVGSSAWVCA